MLFLRAWINQVREREVLQCHQISHDHINAPLLPPNLILNSPDASVDGTIRSTYYRTSHQAREEYKRLQLLPASGKRQRKFVYGALYESLYEGFLEIDPIKCDTDLVVSLDSDHDSVIQIRMIDPESGIGRDKLLPTVISLGNSFCGTGNARGGKVGDLGAMHAIGIRTASTRELYKETSKHAAIVQKASFLMRHWMEDHMRDILQHLLEKDKELGTTGCLDCMPSGPGSRLMYSVNLGNSAHYDKGDTSMSVAVWTEQRPGTASNWFFILPNVSCKGSKGVVVRLHHGVVISWDGRAIYHCTSKTRIGENNKTFGCMWGCSK